MNITSRNKRIRTRFAPSPTGENGMHLGNLRTALFSYLLAKQNNGDFVLRIEDTDQNRSNDNAINDIMNIMKVFNLNYDEFYQQSNRLHLYTFYAHTLVEDAYAYVCNCDKDADASECNCKDMDIEFEKGFSIKLDIDKYFKYKIKSDTIAVYDELRKINIYVKGSELYDIVLLKSDGFPTYHLASVVDDHIMNITDVFRGDEWLSSFPYHTMLYRALGWDMPRFYHLPLIVNKNGKKLSKRDGDFSVKHLLHSGLLPSAILNYVVILGWHPAGNDSEYFSFEDIIKKFDVNRLNNSSACYDEKKLRNINKYHAKTEAGKKEFMTLLAEWGHNLNDEILYEMFKNGANILALFDDISIAKENSTKLNHSYNKVRFLTFIQNYLKNMDADLEFVTDDQSKELENQLILTDYSIKDLNVWFREITTNTTKGYPFNILIRLFSIKSLMDMELKHEDEREETNAQEH